MWKGGGEAAGLGLLPVQVIFHGEKVTRQAQARVATRPPWLTVSDELTGYEIHAGQAATPAPLLEIRRSDGAIVLDGATTVDGQVWGTHLHGLFHNDGLRCAWLASLGWQTATPARPYLTRKAAAYDRLADALAAVMDLKRLDAIIGL